MYLMYWSALTSLSAQLFKILAMHYTIAFTLGDLYLAQVPIQFRKNTMVTAQAQLQPALQHMMVLW
jgi:hypothetical protein